MATLVPFSYGTAPSWPSPFFEARLGRPDEPFGATVAGEVDMATAGRLQEVLFSAIDQSSADVVLVDCRNVKFIDSQGLNALIAAREHSKKTMHRMVLASPPARLLRVLDLTGLRSTFQIMDT